jgi:hypothetical protein
MKKRLIIIFIIVILLLIASLCGCNQKPLFLFSQKTYSIYLDSETTITPSIISDLNIDYTLTSSNDTIVKVEEKNIKALKEGIITLKATHKELVTEAKVMVFSKKLNPYQTFESDGKHVVYFAISQTPAGQQSAFARVSPGDLVSDPNLYDEHVKGFIFEGWYEDITLEKKFDFATPIYKSIALFPKFIPDIPYFNAESYRDIHDNVKYRLLGLKYNNVPYETVELPTVFEIKDEAGNVTATYPFEAINEKAFFENETISEIIIPANYKTIGKSAFEGSKKLKTIHLAGDLETVGEKAFANNSKLETFEANGKIENMGNSILANCINLSNATISDANEISSNTFYNAKALKNFSFGDSITTIGSNAFAFSGLESININNVSSIANRAFFSCNDLSTIDGNKSDFDYIGSEVFGKFDGLLSENHTAWLVTQTNNAHTNGFVKYKNALILAVNPGLKQHYVVKNEMNITYIASGCFSNTNNATIYFELNEAPKLGTKPFGDGTYPDADILISAKNNVSKYINKWLEIAVDAENNKFYSTYSWSLAQKIYARETMSNSIVEYGYRDEIRETTHGIDNPTWDFVDNGYRAVIVNQIMKNIGFTGSEINVITDLNKIHLKNIIDKSTTPEKTTLEKIKPFGINDESTTGMYESQITKVTLPNSGFVFRKKTTDGLKVTTTPILIEKNAIKLPLASAEIYFQDYGDLQNFKVATLESSSFSSPAIYPTNTIKIYVQKNVEAYTTATDWQYIKDKVILITP